MFCRFCGKQLPDGCNFCAYCGNKLAVDAEPACSCCTEAAQAPAEQCAQGGFVDIDITQYRPFDYKITYDPADTKHQFARAEGFMGSMPQKYIDNHLPKCPLCCGSAPNWSFTQIFQMDWKGNLNVYRCSQCGGVISISMPDVLQGSGSFDPNVTLTNIMVKKKAGKAGKTVYVTFEHPGNSGVMAPVFGKEFTIDEVVHMSNRM